MQKVYAVVKTTLNEDSEDVEILSVHTDQHKAYLELLSAAEHYYEYHEVLKESEYAKHFRLDDGTARIRLGIQTSYLWG